MNIDLSGLSDFFDKEFFEVIKRRKGQLQPVEDISRAELAYLVGMMLRFINTNYFYQHYTNSPLYDLVIRQNSKSPITALAGLGDFCLFRTGFFPLSFQTKHTAPRQNFILAGQKAYWLLAKRKISLSEIYHSLSFNFLIFSNLISEIRLRYLSDQGLLELYDLWIETGSEFAKEALRKSGVIPQRFKHLA